MRLRSEILPKLFLAALLVGLIAADRSFDRAELEERSGRVRVERFLSVEESDDLLVAAISVAKGDEASLLYGRADGVWRCLDRYGVLASESAITQLLDSLRNASGLERVSDGEHAAEYGFDTPETWRVTFHGPGLMKDPDRDVQLEVEVGKSRPSLDGCFLRRAGQQEIWAVDTNPRVLLDDEQGGIPLLEPGLVPAFFAGGGRTTVFAEIERRSEPNYSLAMRRAKSSPEESASGASGIRWVLGMQGVEDRELNPVQAISYLSFLSLVRWEDVLDPESLAEWGMDSPMARLTLKSDDGHTLALIVGPSGPGGLHAVVDVTMKCAYLISHEVANLLTPDVEQFIFPDKNPWQGWLQR
ncbi:MAG: DUF4340 domain-containing protein [Planctomycetota bacterium]|nr:DUF4340 domain-containing protein [Planctomycetota bacterium]